MQTIREITQVHREEISADCRECGKTARIRGLCYTHYSYQRRSGQIEIRRPNPLRNRIRRILHNIEGRCGAQPTVHKFEHYAGRGIKNYLTIEDLLFLWNRDDAGQMEQPSIDRKDSTGNYTLTNCRFIEFALNRASADHHKPCTNCGNKTRTRRGLCEACMPAKLCVRCSKPREFSTRPVCDSCRYETRPCTWCGKSVTRDVAATAGHATKRNKQWFCSKQEQGSWLGAKNRREEPTKETL